MGETPEDALRGFEVDGVPRCRPVVCLIRTGETNDHKMLWSPRGFPWLGYKVWRLHHWNSSGVNRYEREISRWVPEPTALGD
jgi:hypothetical protein